MERVGGGDESHFGRDEAEVSTDNMEQTTKDINNSMEKEGDDEVQWFKKGKS